MTNMINMQCWCKLSEVLLEHGNSGVKHGNKFMISNECRSCRERERERESGMIHMVIPPRIRLMDPGCSTESVPFQCQIGEVSWAIGLVGAIGFDLYFLIFFVCQN